MVAYIYNNLLLSLYYLLHNFMVLYNFIGTIPIDILLYNYMVYNCTLSIILFHSLLSLYNYLLYVHI